MNTLSHLRSRPWLMLIIVIGIIAGHAILLHLLRQTRMAHATVSGVIISGVVLLIVTKHLGLLAALLRPLRDLFPHGFRSRKSED